MSLTGSCYFHANDCTRDERGRFVTWHGSRAASRSAFKGGEFKVGVLLKGFEVDNDWAKVLKDDPESRQFLTNLKRTLGTTP